MSEATSAPSVSEQPVVAPASEKPGEVTPQAPEAKVESKVEVKPTEIKPPEAKPTANSKAFAALTREEKRVRQAKAELEKKQSELATKEKAVKEAEARAAAIEAKLAAARENPLEALDSLGLSLDDVTKAVAAGKIPPDPAMKALREVERLRKEQAEEKERAEKARVAAEEAEAKAELERLAAEEAATLKEWADGVKGTLAKEAGPSGRFALINKFGFGDFVVAEVKRRSEEKGEVVSELEVADVLEKQLRAEVLAAMEMDWVKEMKKPEEKKPEAETQDPEAQQVTPEAKTQELPPTATPRERAMAMLKRQRQEKQEALKPSLSDPNFKPSSDGPSKTPTFAENRAAAIARAKAQLQKNGATR